MIEYDNTPIEYRPFSEAALTDYEKLIRTALATQRKIESGEFVLVSRDTPDGRTDAEDAMCAAVEQLHKIQPPHRDPDAPANVWNPHGKIVAVQEKLASGCIDEGCPHFGQDVTCSPKEGGCTCTYNNPEGRKTMTDTEIALEAVIYCDSVLHGTNQPKETSLVWSAGTVSRPHISLKTLETIRIALETQKKIEAGEFLLVQNPDELLGALELADAALSGANMYMKAVERKVKGALKKLKGGKDKNHD